MHEEVEKTLIDQLDRHYLHAHQIATRAEEAAVRAARIPWRAYDAFMQKYVKKVGDEHLRKVPKDLDLKPYRDYHDWDLMRRMEQAVDAGRLPRALAALHQEIAAYNAAFHEQHRDGTRKVRRHKPAVGTKAKTPRTRR
ncbi:MAG: hypothetical protein EPN72_09705 [Nevskiaceae bacterium]|nr:MAG: hypothetical protein EPN63_09045 [Nevskiaceae bacterium]TBR72703.1 MAG: hypothetical protein EPN72_09705 [Nevskiaceae bacterium]